MSAPRFVLFFALGASLVLAGCYDARGACRRDCQRTYEECLMPASTPAAIYACDARASTCLAYCR